MLIITYGWLFNGSFCFLFIVFFLFPKKRKCICFTVCFTNVTDSTQNAEVLDCFFFPLSHFILHTILNVVLKTQTNGNGMAAIDFYTVDCFQSYFLVFYSLIALVLYILLNFVVSKEWNDTLILGTAVFGMVFLINAKFNENNDDCRIKIIKQHENMMLQHKQQQQQQSTVNKNQNAYKIEKKNCFQNIFKWQCCVKIVNNQCVNKMKQQWQKHQTIIQLSLSVISSIITLIVAINAWINASGDLFLYLEYEILCIVSIVMFVTECWNFLCYLWPENYLKKIFPSDTRYRFLLIGKFFKLFNKASIISQIQFNFVLLIFQKTQFNAHNK